MIGYDTPPERVAGRRRLGHVARAGIGPRAAWPERGHRAAAPVAGDGHTARTLDVTRICVRDGEAGDAIVRVRVLNRETAREVAAGCYRGGTALGDVETRHG